MSQRTVERFIGRLATDEALRRRFVADPRGLIEEIRRECGADLNECERNALAALDLEALAAFAERIDPRLQKSDLTGGCR